MSKMLTSFLGFSTILALTSCQNARQNFSSPDVLEETYVHRYGVPVSPEDWSADGNHGQIVTTLSNGVVVTKSYSSGILDGDTTYSYPHSKAMHKVESYINGVLQKEDLFYLSGAPQQEILHNSPQNSTITSWYESGSPKSKEQMQGDLLFQATYYDEESQVDSQVINYQGLRTRRDDYGQLLSVDTIDKGLISLRTTYHPNHSPKDVIPYVNAQIHGLVKTYFPGGEPNTIEEWTNGIQSGITTEYLNGEKVSECPYIEGQKQGTEKRFRDSTVVIQEISWDKGQKHGPSISYVGNLTKTDWFWQGKQINKASYDMITGQGGTKKGIWSTTKS